MTFRSGVINLDQADLLSTSRGGSALIMTWGAARPGGNPAATSTKDALSNALCDIDLSTVRKALINVTGSSDLALEDSLVASEVLRKRTKDNARIIWGVNILQDLGEDMEVFIILSTTPMELLLHWYSNQK
jgi:cell division protein FtsZ